MDDDMIYLLINTKKMKASSNTPPPECDTKPLKNVCEFIELEAAKKKEIANNIEDFASFFQKRAQQAISDYCKARKTD